MIVSPSVISLLLAVVPAGVALAMLVVRIVWHFLRRALAERWPTPDPVAAVAAGVVRLGELLDEALDLAQGRHAEIMKMAAALGDAMIAVAKTKPVVTVELWSDSGRTSTIRAANDEPEKEPPTETVPPVGRRRSSNAYASQHGALPADPEQPAEITGPRHAAPEKPDPSAESDVEVPTEMVPAVTG